MGVCVLAMLDQWQGQVLIDSMNSIFINAKKKVYLMKSFLF